MDPIIVYIAPLKKVAPIITSNIFNIFIIEIVTPVRFIAYKRIIIPGMISVNPIKLKY